MEFLLSEVRVLGASSSTHLYIRTSRLYNLLHNLSTDLYTFTFICK